MKQRPYIIPIFIPDLGCPNRCVFCNQKKITGQSSVPGPEQVKKTIDEYLQTIPEGTAARIEVAFYGGSFTAIPKEEQRSLLKEAWKYVPDARVSGIRVSTRPDRIDEEILGILMGHGVTTIELGVQSMNDEVLQLALRGHSVKDVEKASDLIRSWGFFLGIQVMIGLPGDSQEKALETCDSVIKLSPNFVRIYPVLVLKDTKLADMLEMGEYSPWSIEAVIGTAKVMLNRFERAGIEVIRIGLQNTEEISPGGEIIAGPYHPAIGELVYASLALDQLRELLERAGISPGSVRQIQISIPPRDESKVRGQKSENIKKISDEYLLDAVWLVPEKELQPGVIKLTQIDERPVELTIRRVDLTL